MKKQDFDVEFAEEVLLRENEGQVTLPHRGRFAGKKSEKEESGEIKSKTENKRERER